MRISIRLLIQRIKERILVTNHHDKIEARIIETYRFEHQEVTTMMGDKHELCDLLKAIQESCTQKQVSMAGEFLLFGDAYP